MIRNILDVLEKTQLVFSVKPYGGAGKVVKKPWKYYFLSPSINAAIRFKLNIGHKRNKHEEGDSSYTHNKFCVCVMHAHKEGGVGKI